MKGFVKQVFSSARECCENHSKTTFVTTTFDFNILRFFNVENGCQRTQTIWKLPVSCHGFCKIYLIWSHSTVLSNTKWLSINTRVESSTPQHSYSTATAFDFLKQLSKYSTAVKKQLYSTTQHFTAVFTAVHSYCVKKY